MSLPMAFLHMQVIVSTDAGDFIAEAPDDQDEDSIVRNALEQFTFLYRRVSCTTVSPYEHI